MNETVKKEWVAALRSGEYKQGREYLHINDRHCCLGVLCEIAIKHGLDLPLNTRKTYNDRIVHSYDSSEHVLPVKVYEWAGLDEDSPTVVEFDDTVSALAGMNDEGMSFERIADVIEEKL